MDAVAPVEGSASIWSTGLEERVTHRDVSVVFISAAAVSSFHKPSDTKSRHYGSKHGPLEIKTPVCFPWVELSPGVIGGCL